VVGHGWRGAHGQLQQDVLLRFTPGGWAVPSSFLNALPSFMTQPEALLASQHADVGERVTRHGEDVGRALPLDGAGGLRDRAALGCRLRGATMTCMGIIPCWTIRLQFAGIGTVDSHAGCPCPIAMRTPRSTRGLKLAWVRNQHFLRLAHAVFPAWSRASPRRGAGRTQGR